MLILIAGISGNLGKYLAEHGLAKGNQIRGFGRTPSKLAPNILARLESFVQCDHYTDRAALQRAVAGVDAVICSYASHPDAILDAQLALLRAVEEAGIKVYHAHSWNSDWRKIGFGEFEHYDAYLSFRRQVDLSSGVKPVYVFTGILGEFAVSEMVGIAHIGKNKGGGDGKEITTLRYWGDGTAKWDFTYLSDAARFSIELLMTDKSVQAGHGGFFSIHSASASALDLAKAYEKLHPGETLALESLGGLPELDQGLVEARATTDLHNYFSFGNFFIQAAAIRGTWKLDDPVNVGVPDAVERLFDSQIAIPDDYL
ncbi:hypothetical protein B0T24DRAFT_690945 [Lasiosphaeria ovina]|uniref:NmrA-like domain-containing protein n=1 Tax=Lasiosphaeria ovina TaxID=92902 RepID=A0AAE0JV99_9PEZI|nr:hypothetical protein B0T24DRAFT_690945 [Lasiosphaeria ovina]